MFWRVLLMYFVECREFVSIWCFFRIQQSWWVFRKNITKMKLSSHCIILCPTLCNLMDCSPPGSSVHGMFQARMLAWVAVSSSEESPWATGQTWVSCVSCIAGGSFYHWAIRGAPTSGYDIHNIINGDVKLEHLVQVESARFPHYNITVFPFPHPTRRWERLSST